MRTYRITAVLCCLSVAATSHAADAFHVTELPHERGTLLEPYALNDLGQVVGTMRRDDGPWRLFLWDRTHGLQDLAPVYPAQCDINNQGQIVAAAPSPDASLRAFLREPDGRIEYLGAPRQTSRAFALNERGQVVGWIFHADRGTRRAFLWDRTSGLRELTTPQGTPAVATAISDTGHIFGHLQYHLGTRLQQRPCCWPHTDAPTLEPAVDTPASEFYSINGKGWVVGRYVFMDSGPHAVLWRPDAGLVKLFPYRNADEAFTPVTFRVNDANQVACVEQTHAPWPERLDDTGPATERRHYLWDPARGRIPFDACLPPETCEFILRDLNNHGVILGLACLPDGTRRPLLLEPPS